MKRVLITMFVLLISCHYILGQFSLFGPGSLKLIEKGEFADAEKKINKDLLKTPDDIETNYAMSLLLAQRNYTGYNTEKSYEYLTKCIRLFENVKGENDLKKLNKIPINQTVFLNLTDTVCRLAMEDAITKNNLEAYVRYLDYYKTAPESYRKKIIENRDVSAYKIACDKNSLESFEYFISNYPDAIQYADVISKRNVSAFQKARQSDNIDSYKDFVIRYPSANEVMLAWDRIHELAFSQAEKENTSASYKKFLTDYPYCKQFSQASGLYDKRLYAETITSNDWNDYRLFVEKYPTNSLKQIALDSIYSIAMKTENLEVLKYCVDNFTGMKRDNALILYHDVFTLDGEKLTLDLFYDKYHDEVLNQLKTKDYEILALSNELTLCSPYKIADFPVYDEYVRLAAPRDKAFLALQRIISPDIEAKNYQAAISKILTYVSFFGTRNKKLLNLITFLETK